MRFTIRPYEPADQDWLLASEIALQEHERAVHDPRLPLTRRPALPYTHEYIALLWETLREKQGAMLIAVDAEGRQAGLVAGNVADAPWPMEMPDSTRYGYVADIYIEPRARGSGLARILLDAIAAHLHAVAPDLTRLRINVMAANAIARGAYEKAGFIPYEVMYERKLP